MDKYKNMIIGIKNFQINMINKNNAFTGFKDDHEKNNNQLTEAMIEEV